MVSEAERWTQVGAIMKARLKSAGVTQAELARLSKVSDTTIRSYFRGKPVVRVDKKRAISLALWGVPDAIDRLYAGEAETQILKDGLAVDSQDRDDIEGRLTRIEDRLDRHDEKLDQILDALRGAQG